MLLKHFSRRTILSSNLQAIFSERLARGSLTQSEQRNYSSQNCYDTALYPRVLSHIIVRAFCRNFLHLAPSLDSLQPCRRFETGGSLGRRVNVAACPSPDGSSARASAKGGRARRPETGVREVGIPRPSCSSRAQVGCACSRGLQASTRERERAAPSERLFSSSSPRGQPSLRGPWSFLL
jgi:hypothetical protein